MPNTLGHYPMNIVLMQMVLLTTMESNLKSKILELFLKELERLLWNPSTGNTLQLNGRQWAPSNLIQSQTSPLTQPGYGRELFLKWNTTLTICTGSKLHGRLNLMEGMNLDTYCLIPMAISEEMEQCMTLEDGQSLRLNVLKVSIIFLSNLLLIQEYIQ